MMRSIPFFISVTLCLWAKATFGQFRNTELKGDHTFKIQGSATPYEGGAGISHQYYLTQHLGLQTNVDILFPSRNLYFYSEDYKLSGIGWRLLPEFRYYTNREERDNMTSFFLGGSPIIKYIQFGESAWERRFDDVTLTSYKQLYVANYRNFALGLMGRGGIEAYIGRAQRLVFEGSLGLGFTQNWVKIKEMICFQRMVMTLTSLYLPTIVKKVCTHISTSESALAIGYLGK